MGGPSAAIVIEELIGLGARVLVRIGTCGAFDAGASSSGELVTADAGAGRRRGDRGRSGAAGALAAGRRR